MHAHTGGRGRAHWSSTNAQGAHHTLLSRRGGLRGERGASTWGATGGGGARRRVLVAEADNGATQSPAGFGKAKARRAALFGGLAMLTQWRFGVGPSVAGDNLKAQEERILGDIREREAITGDVGPPPQDSTGPIRSEADPASGAGSSEGSRPTTPPPPSSDEPAASSGTKGDATVEGEKKSENIFTVRKSRLREIEEVRPARTSFRSNLPIPPSEGWTCADTRTRHTPHPLARAFVLSFVRLFAAQG